MCWDGDVMSGQESGEKPSRDARIDMAIPESFHRVKRTLIILCSILILLAVSKPENSDDAFFNMQLLSLHVPMAPARLLLWLSAAYYFIGLCLEADTARRVNTRLFDGGMGTFQDALAAAAQKVARRTDNVENSERNLSLDAREAIERIKQIKVDIAKDRALELLDLKMVSVRNLVDVDKNPNETMRRIVSEVITETPSDTASLQQHLKNDLGLLEHRLGRHDEVIGRLLAEVEAASKDLTKLSRRIAGSRRASFWYWEIGAGVALFGMATIATIHAQFPNIWTSFVAFHSAIGA